MTTARHTLLLVLAVCALTWAALAPTADAAKPAKLGDRAGMQLLADLGKAEKRANPTGKDAGVAKATRAQARVFTRYSKKVRAGKCQRHLRGLAKYFDNAASVVQRYGLDSPQARKVGKPVEAKLMRMSGACA